VPSWKERIFPFMQGCKKTQDKQFTKEIHLLHLTQLPDEITLVPLKKF
jgi:hypothetical protein